MTEQEQMRDIALDALALICAAARGDAEGAATVLMTYTDPAELAQLNAALIGHASHILRIASEASGICPDKLLGGVYTSLRECGNAQV